MSTSAAPARHRSATRSGSTSRTPTTGSLMASRTICHWPASPSATWPGVDGVLGTSDDLILTTTTSSTGIYAFTNLPWGTYTVAVDPTTLPAGLAPTYDLDGVATANVVTEVIDGSTATRWTSTSATRVPATSATPCGTTSTATACSTRASPHFRASASRSCGSASTASSVPPTTSPTSSSPTPTGAMRSASSRRVRTTSRSIPPRCPGYMPTYDLDGGKDRRAAVVLAAGEHTDLVDLGEHEEADLSITKSHPSGVVRAGDDVTYTLTVRNLGPGTARNVVVTDTLPTGLSYHEASGTGWSCSAIALVVTSTLAGDLAANTSAPLTITAITSISGRARGDELGVGHQLDDRSGAVQQRRRGPNRRPVDLRLSKDLSAPLVPNGQGLYHLTVTNAASPALLPVPSPSPIHCPQAWPRSRRPARASRARSQPPSRVSRPP